MALRPPAPRGGPLRAFSLIEVLFAIAIMGIAIIGILSLFTTGLVSSSASQNLTTAASTAQSLAARVTTEVDGSTPPGHPFLDRIIQGKSWIQDNSNSNVPALVDTANPDSDLFWSCRVSKNLMNPNSYDDPTKDDATQPYTTGLFQIAVFVYRNYKPGKTPVTVYTTLVTAGY